MKFETATDHLKGLPFIHPVNAKKLYDFILENDVEHILELGFAHGTATCYMAAALQERQSGKIDAVDLHSARSEFNPAAEDLLRQLDLEAYVNIHRMKSGYNWFLHNKIHAQSREYACRPCYDLIIIDGPKNWTIDSSSFFLADKLLNTDGWIIWDDLNWTYQSADKKRDTTDGIQHHTLDEDERSIPHIREIVDLLVKQHPSYGQFEIHAEGDWCWAQKSASESKHVKVTVNRSWFSMIQQILFNLIKRLRS